jgi:hypothetical protein
MPRSPRLAAYRTYRRPAIPPYWCCPGSKIPGLAPDYHPMGQQVHRRAMPGHQVFHKALLQGCLRNESALPTMGRTHRHPAAQGYYGSMEEVQVEPSLLCLHVVLTVVCSMFEHQHVIHSSHHAQS